MATKIIRDRKAAEKRAKAKGVDAATARKRNYVRTRAAEMEAKGMKADKAALRKKFESGQVARKGFYAKGEGAALRNKAKRKGAGGGTRTVAPRPKDRPGGPEGTLGPRKRSRIKSGPAH